MFYQRPVQRAFSLILWCVVGKSQKGTEERNVPEWHANPVIVQRERTLNMVYMLAQYEDVV